MDKSNRHALDKSIRYALPDNTLILTQANPTLINLYNFCSEANVFIYANGLTPEPITELFVRNRDVQDYETRQRSDPRLTKLKYAIPRASFQCLGPKLWSSLSMPLRNVQCSKVFAKRYKKGYSINYLV